MLHKCEWSVPASRLAILPPLTFAKPHLRHQLHKQITTSFVAPKSPYLLAGGGAWVEVKIV
jgi:hypothetical protein